MFICNLLFICVNFNNSSYTKKFIDSLKYQVGFDDVFSLRCVVVDNSTDERDVKELEQYCSSVDWVTNIRSKNNIGYFGGLNLGLENIKQENSKFVIVCNNDLEFEKTFCEELCKLKIQENVFSICPDIITPEQHHQNPHIFKRISKFRRFSFDLFFSHYYVACLLLFIKKILPSKKIRYVSESCEIHMGVGACYVLTKNFLDNFKTLTYPFFLYGEEAFFSDQIHSKNGILIYEPKLKVYHAESATLSKVPKRVSYEFAREGYPSYRELM